MSDDELTIAYRLIEVWESAFKVAAVTQNFDKAREEADAAVQACKKAVGL